ncbi:hypothetical protein COU01_03545 [Candidatus Falkowbacteria bacterium CG10_big_fil_rev_8_21_14_0_10_44_15]|uniref:M23ase beta-sheet core domain-containing protein n=1 Tax=Candidatus Falkowbacteria bacterium CG10_big_fil_rev_8_21_14_0_10_44_15 TaxID=1974569 RepID=A0A2H0V0Y2_9BACT|nr:MAG: hypothetical protein COU01_03545 [Candidatus Falkowbacteria bacterium CG10_big_fil_rev_8_21_14_0_10_44_15]
MKVSQNMLYDLVLFIGFTQCLEVRAAVKRADIPVATYFYMPVGERNADLRSDLKWEFRPETNSNPTWVFPGYNGTTNTTGWYVFTNFNQNVNYDGTDYTNSEYHPGEDWNGNGGGNTDDGQPVYASAIGRVIYVQNTTTTRTFGRMVQIVHKLPNDSYVITMYAHMDQLLVNEGQLVYPTTQIGTVGNTGTDVAHLHWEIRKDSFLDLTNSATIGLKNEGAGYTANFNPTAWPATNTTFIANNYLQPSYVVQQYGIVGKVNFLQSSVYQRAFEDCFYANGGHDRFGSPWNNSSFGPYVHPWPDDANDQNVLYLQDFIEPDGHWWQIVDNPAAGAAFPVHGQILTYWHNNWGYSNYGSPSSNEYYATGTATGHQLVVQTFARGYITYDTVTGVAYATTEPDFVIAGGPDITPTPNPVSETKY